MTSSLIHPHHPNSEKPPLDGRGLRSNKPTNQPAVRSRPATRQRCPVCAISGISPFSKCEKRRMSLQCGMSLLCLCIKSCCTGSKYLCRCSRTNETSSPHVHYYLQSKMLLGQVLLAYEPVRRWTDDSPPSSFHTFLTNGVCYVIRVR